MLRFTTPIRNLSKKVVELRIHDLKPSLYEDFLALASKMLPQRSSISRCRGMWTSRIGCINQVMSLWEYDSMNHRREIREALANDKEWIRSYRVPHSSMLLSQQSMILRELQHEGTVSTSSYTYRITFDPHGVDTVEDSRVMQAAKYQVLLGERAGSFVYLHKSRDIDVLIPEKAPELGASNQIIHALPFTTAIGCTWR